jgi:hypothetical protein
MDNRMIEKLRKVEKKTGSPVVKELIKDKEYEETCSLAYRLFDEMMEEFREGEMSWKEAVADLKENLLALDMPVPPEVEEEMEEEED